MLSVTIWFFNFFFKFYLIFLNFLFYFCKRNKSITCQVFRVTCGQCHVIMSSFHYQNNFNLVSIITKLKSLFMYLD